MSDPALTSFAPARSYGWAWLVGLIALVVLPVLPLFMLETPPEGEDAVALWVTVAIMLPLVGFLLATLVSLPLMRYELTRDALVLSCGPLLRYRIPFAEIVDVRRTDLSPSLWSSMRMPGLALWGVPYADAGKVYMCATRMAKGVMLVSTATKRYGLTPSDEDAFVTALRMMLPRTDT